MKKFEYYKNPNAEVLKEIEEAVKANDGYCPCLVEKNEDTKCMCKDFRESNEMGSCHCGRYYKIPKCELVTLIYSPLFSEDDARTYFSWKEKLEKGGFLMFEIEVDENDLFNIKLLELNKVKIAKSSIVIVLDEITDQNSEYFYLLKDWAEEIYKPFVNAYGVEIGEIGE
jgi:hypothetical protein